MRIKEHRMYPELFSDSLALVSGTREKNIENNPTRMTAEEKESVLRAHHPDFNGDAFRPLRVGANKGDRAPSELADILESHSRVSLADINLYNPDYDVDVLIIGGGGAGAAAAIEARLEGAKPLIVTKLRMGDSNTVMAAGGIQAADKAADSPAIHFLDTFGGGRFAANRELVAQLVTHGPEARAWLSSLGVEFDKEKDGSMITSHGGGTSRRRMHSSRDLTGAGIMRTLSDEVRCLEIGKLEHTSAIELILDTGGAVFGAILMDMQTERLIIARAKTVIIATGGAGRLHFGGFPTSNHYGATADGLTLAYRAGARLTHIDSMQYHPTGAVYPTSLSGSLITEKARALGAKLVNGRGEVFVHPLESRDVCAASIIRECTRCGIDTGHGIGVWLDTPMIEKVSGEGAIQKHLPALFYEFSRCGIDIRKEPILVYPTLHYQNGGIEIDKDCTVRGVKNLFAAGEVTGGIHGKNRLMGNSLLDIIVFGRIAGKNAARAARCAEVGTPTLSHVEKFESALAESGIETDSVSPALFPNYKNHKNQAYI